MEGQNLLSMVIGRAFNAELRNTLIQAGFRRLGSTQWISKETAAKYEFILSDDEFKTVDGVDLIDGNHRVHLKDSQEMVEDSAGVNCKLDFVDPIYDIVMSQLEVTDFMLETMDQWNESIYRGTDMGLQLRELCKLNQISWDNFLVLPDPMASGEYLFCTIAGSGSPDLWLKMLDDREMVPALSTAESAWDSLRQGLEFHRWEAETFETAAAAGQYAIKMLNGSQTPYARTVRHLLDKDEAKITRNDFYRDADNVMCYIEVVRDEHGLHFTDVPCLPTIVDAINSLLAPYYKARALRD